MLSKSALDLYVEARATPDIDAERHSKLLLARELDGTGTELRDIESWPWRTAELRCDAYPNL